MARTISKGKIAIIDSNIYIDLFRNGLYQDELSKINRNFIIRNSAVVLLELFIGAKEKKEKKLILKMERDLGIINPPPQNWIESGEILNRLKIKHGFDRRKIRDLVNDTLIATSARGNGAMVITNNGSDFELIREIRLFDLIVI